MAGMFFPMCSEAQQLTTVQQPASLVLAGESSTIKTALLLQYAYNAALRGEKLQVAVLARLQPCATGLLISHRLPFSGLFSASPLARNPSSRFLVKLFGVSLSAHLDLARCGLAQACGRTFCFVVSFSPGPSPANEAALQYIVFKYVSCARDMRCAHELVFFICVLV